MFVRIKERNHGKKSVQIVENYRSGSKIRQKIIRHIGQAVSEKELRVLRSLAQWVIVEARNKKQPVFSLFKPEDVYGRRNKKPTKDKVEIDQLREEHRIIEGIGEIFGKIYSDLGFDDLIGGTKKDSQWNGILKSCVIARISNPESKRKTADLLEEDYAIRIPLEKIYRMMDHAGEREDLIKKRVGETTKSLFKEKVDVLFFDVTTLYFESIETDDLKKFGFSKDCKFKETQIVFALVTTSKGLPVTYEIFPGNMYEGHTLITIVNNLKQKHDIERVVLVADRAMFNDENLKLMESERIDYIVAARLKSLNTKLKTQIIEDADFKANVVNDEFYWSKEFKYNDRRLIVSYNVRRARKDAADRARLVERLLKKSKDNKIKLKDLIPNYGSKKFVTVNNQTVTVNDEKIDAEAKWDGFHGVITNVKEDSVVKILSRYAGLWQIEEAFRVSKHDLKFRPIYHWTPQRIKSHILICFLAFTLVKQVLYRVKMKNIDMSFDKIRNELLHVQSSLMVDIKTQKRYLIPSHVTTNQNRIYQAVGLDRSDVPCSIENE